VWIHEANLGATITGPKADLNPRPQLLPQRLDIVIDTRSTTHRKFRDVCNFDQIPVRASG
jgi:hypothetical protein